MPQTMSTSSAPLASQRLPLPNFKHFFFMELGAIDPSALTE
jgi:hypothetical protein